MTIYFLFWENIFANSSEHFRLQSRVAVSRLSRRAIPKAVCASFYRGTAERVLNILSEISGVKSVRLKGASLTRCDPGMSDLDFLVLYDRTYRDLKLLTLLKRLRITFLDLKREFPLFGEFKLVSEATWEQDSPAGHFECIDFGQHFVLDSEKKGLVEINELPVVTPREKMRYAFFFYSRAIARINLSLEGSDQNYHFARARRDLGKLISVINEVPEIMSPPSTLAQLFALAFTEIENLARLSGSPGREPCRAEFIPSDNDSTTERRLLKRHAVSRYNQLARGELKFRYTPAGRVVPTENFVESSTLARFLENFLEVARLKKSRALPLWVLVGPQTFARFREGLANREVLENAELLGALRTTPDFKKLCALNFESVRENWKDLNHRVLGDLICADLTQARQVVYEFHLATLLLRQRRLTLDTSALGSRLLPELKSQSRPRTFLFQTMVDSQNEIDSLGSCPGA